MNISNQVNNHGNAYGGYSMEQKQRKGELFGVFFSSCLEENPAEIGNEAKKSGFGKEQNIAPVAAENMNSAVTSRIASAASRGIKPEEGFRSASRAPYEHLAKDGVIEYNGATFILDFEKNSINLGDVSIEAKREGKVIAVALEGGGSFNFNVENMDQLGRAITLFSPEDMNRIMRAIHQYNMAQSKQKEIEDTKESVFQNSTI